MSKPAKVELGQDIGAKLLELGLLTGESADEWDAPYATLSDDGRQHMSHLTKRQYRRVVLAMTGQDPFPGQLEPEQGA